MKNLSFPTAHTILLLILVVVAILTYIIPSGKFDTLLYIASDDVFEINGSTTISATQESLDKLGVRIPLEKFTSGDLYKAISIPNTFRFVDANPQGLAAMVQAPVKGVIEAADIIFLVLFIGGFVAIMNLTGAFDAGIYWLSIFLKGREYLLIILTTVLFAIAGTTFGMAEETLAFFPILIPVFIAARYDALVGFACIFLGSSIGFMCSTINPFATIIASDAAGINWTNGLDRRVFMFCLCLFVTIIFILRYARRVKRDPGSSLIFDQNKEHRNLFMSGANGGEFKSLTWRHKLILLIFSSCFLIMIYGVSVLDWWFVEMTATFLVGAIILGVVARLKEKEIVDSFSSGAGDLLGVAFIIGIARGVSIMMSDGLISDSVLFYAGSFTEDLSKGVLVNAMFLIYNCLSFFIPSSSGMAVLTMPILSPLADAVGIGRDVIVDTYLYGQGVFALINPTALILASLTVVKIGYDKWLRFVWPLVLILILISMIVLTMSV